VRHRAAFHISATVLPALARNIQVGPGTPPRSLLSVKGISSLRYHTSEITLPRLNTIIKDFSQFSKNKSEPILTRSKPYLVSKCLSIS
jgi:hypothetical protein